MRWRTAVLVLVAVLAIAMFGGADQTVTTKDGQVVLLKDDGTWEYVSQSSGQTLGKWNTNVTVDPISDDKRFVVRLVADSGASTYRDPILLMLRKAGSSTEVFIVWSNYLGSDARVTWRIGDQGSQTAKWSLSTDSQATFYPRSDVKLIQDLTTVDQFVARVTPYSESPVTAVFDVRGLKDVIAEFPELSDWLPAD